MELNARDSKRYFMEMWRMSTGRPCPPELYDGSGNLAEGWLCLPLIDWTVVMGVDNNELYSDSQETTIWGGLNTLAQDWTLTFSPQANGLFANGNSKVWLVHEEQEILTMLADGKFAAAS